MNEKLILLLLLFSFVQLSTLKHSEEIWDKFYEYVQKGEKIYLESKNYFIFDETNYTNLHVNSTKMKTLYNLQKNFYNKHIVKNYIFLIDELGSETIDSFTNSLYNLISKNFSLTLSSSVIIVIPISDRLIRIKPGYSTNYNYDDYYIDIIISNLRPYMTSKDYYSGCVKLMQDLEYYYGMKYTNYDNNKNDYDSSGTDYDTIKTILGVIFVIAVLIIVAYCRSKGNCQDVGSSSSYIDFNVGSSSHHHTSHSSGGHRSGGGGGGHRSGGGGGGHHSGGRTGGW